MVTDQTNALKKAIEAELKARGSFMKKRDLFVELMRGVGEMVAQREGEIALRSHSVQDKPAPELGAKENVETQCSVRLVDQAGGEISRNG
ncbi:hypothetical protein [Pseudomonas fluorescens]|uniref:hypothetical protein n=1 Tax=Pseudomonas fluorescens TaxID=294 RepID=UPI003D1C2625